MESHDKRVIYRVTLKLLSLIGIAILIYIFLASFFDGRTTKRSPVISVNLADLKPGEHIKRDWGGRKVIVLHRSAAMLAGIASMDESLYDPHSKYSNQPVYARNAYRAIGPAYFIAVAMARDTGCEVEFMPGRAGEGGSQGGFVDPCRGSRYDLAGRVFKNQQTKLNLTIPEYCYTSGTMVTIGAGC